jgi:Coenzyme PQQ synthesis protein D (PqqD)
MNTSSSHSELFQTALLVASEDQISSEVAGESVILDLKSGTYFGLDEVGKRVWELIQTPRYFADLLKTLCSEYAVSPEVCERDLIVLLQALYTAKLIQVTHEEIA